MSKRWEVQPDAGYTSGQATRVTGITYKQLRHWAESGLIEPSIAATSGTGRERRYGFEDLVALRIAGELRAKGVSLSVLWRVVESFRSAQWGHSEASAQVVMAISGDDATLVRGDSLVRDLPVSSITTLIAVNVGAVCKEITQEISRLA